MLILYEVIMDFQKKQHWADIFEQQKNSGLTITKFCRQQQLNTSTFYAWRNKVTKNSHDKLPVKHKQQLVPLMLSTSSVVTEVSLTLTTPAGYQLAFNDRLSPVNLAALLNVMP